MNLMKRITLLPSLFFILLFSQDLPDAWSQSYCTYDRAEVGAPGDYSFGFAVDNFALYSNDPDTVSYDERRFDIFAKLSIFRRMEVELKYSSPTAGLVAGKYQFLAGNVNVALKLGFGYMKGTRSGYITDYVFDFYPTLIMTKKLYKGIGLYLAPKCIYSIHPRDTREHSNREPRHIFQYGYGIGLMIGDKFRVMPEANWLFGNNRGVKYTVNQFGIGVNLKIGSS